MDLTKVNTTAQSEISQFRVKTKPTVLPVALETVKTWLKRTGTSSEDALITSLIKESADHVQNIIGRSLTARTCEYYLPNAPEQIFLPFTAASIVSVKDSTGAAVTFSTRGLSNKYVVISNSPIPKDITVEYISGSTTADEIEDGILSALKKLITELYENRGDSASINISGVSEATRISVGKLLYPYRRNLLC
jgi:hypothetical protein